MQTRTIVKNAKYKLYTWSSKFCKTAQKICGRQKNDPLPTEVHILIPGTHEYVRLHGKREIQVANQLTLK